MIRPAAGALLLAALALSSCGDDPAPTSPIERIGKGAGVETIGPAECVVGHSCAVVIVYRPSGDGAAAEDQTLEAAVRPTIREVLRERPDTTHLQVSVVVGSEPGADTSLRVTCDDPSLKTVRWDDLSPADLRSRCDVQSF